MNALCWLAMLLSGADAVPPPRMPLAMLQGVWHGEAQYADTTLIICGDTLLGVNERVGDER